MTKIIEGFTHHTIDEYGTVINTKTNHTKAQWLGANSYLHVDIQENGITKKVAVHRLLALNYLPNTENKRTVNHKDGNKQNNCLTNLEWSTVSENVKHAYDTGLQPYRRKLSKSDYKELLTKEFLESGKSITTIAESKGLGLTQLSCYRSRTASRIRSRANPAENRTS